MSPRRCVIFPKKHRLPNYLRHIVSICFLFTMVSEAYAACVFTLAGSTGAISFNNVDPSTAPGPILGSVTTQVYFTCDYGAAFTVTATPGSGWTLTSGANSMAYTLGFIASGTGQGLLSPIALLTDNSSITKASYENTPAGAYTNNQSVTLTINCPTCLLYLIPIQATIPAGNVSGSVINTCAVTQSAGTLTFDIDPSVTGTTIGSIAQELKIKCTKNDNIAITSSSGYGGASPKMYCSSSSSCGSYQIPYTFIRSSGGTGLGFGIGNDIALGIGGSVSSSDYANAPAGSYDDLETITISY